MLFSKCVGAPKYGSNDCCSYLIAHTLCDRCSQKALSESATDSSVSGDEGGHRWSSSSEESDSDNSVYLHRKRRLWLFGMTVVYRRRGGALGREAGKGFDVCE